jgi:MbtH protein
LQVNSSSLAGFSKLCVIFGVIMNWNDQEDTTIYKVVVNHEQQYSIWPSERENALGWKDVGKSGTKAECLTYIKEVWTDMRPLSLRQQMEKSAQ